MARYTGPKAKKARAVGFDIGIKSKILIKRNYPPGVHGQKVNRRQSAYGLQLMEKQKARLMYGLLERQFRNYFKRAYQKEGNTGENLLQLLETRLDNVVFRMGFGITRDQARQIVNHKHITVNGKVVNIPSYQLRIKDKIEINQNKKERSYWKEIEKSLNKEVNTPNWIVVDVKNMSGTIDHLPAKEELNVGLSMPHIVEFYSR